MTFASVRLGLFVVTYSVHAHSGTHYKYYLFHILNMSTETFPQSPFPDGWLRLFFFVTKKEGASLISSVKAYSVRAVATSLAFFNQASLDQVVRVGTLVSPNTFISFYLKQGMTLATGPLARRRFSAVGPVRATSRHFGLARMC